MNRSPNINALWASMLVEECVRCGVDTFFLAPGARCAPLTFAVAQHQEVRPVKHFDERGLAFAALGYARATGRPGVLICTSGTAVMNFAPAVAEAAAEELPLLLLTADRPPELRECGANQSLRQSNLLPEHLSWHFELPCPDPTVSPAFVLTTLDEALRRSSRGPVQLNCPFREPLGLQKDRCDMDAILFPVYEWLRNGLPYTRTYPPVERVEELDAVGLEELLPARARVLVLVGGGLLESEALAVEQLAQQRGWPVVSDVQSGLHFGPRSGEVVRHVDALCSAEGFVSGLEPDRILQFGSRFISKSLLQALEASPLISWVSVSRRQGRFDPLHRVTHRYQSEAGSFCSLFEKGEADPELEVWRKRWLDADASAEALLAEELDDLHRLTEIGAVRKLTKLLPPYHGLFIGASLPVRDVNRYAYPNPSRVHVGSNRGASGIDGILATASGFARGLQQCCTVLLGDLSTLHDLNSLALIGSRKFPVIVVVINNRGGGIFQELPFLDAAEQVEDYFITPHEMSFEHAAAQFGLLYACPEDLPDFEETYREALMERRSCLIEVQCSREESRMLRMQLAEALQLGT